MKKFNSNAAIRSAIRRVFSRSPVVREVMHKVRREIPKFNKDGTRAKKDSVQYQCNVCKTWTKSTAIAVDHEIPVIDINEGFKDWNTFVDRVFCDPENLQVICDTCHNTKTNEERDLRNSKVDAQILKGIKDDLYTRDLLPIEHKKTLKRLIARKGQPHEDIRNTAKELLDTFFPKKKGKT